MSSAPLSSVPLSDRDREDRQACEQAVRIQQLRRQIEDVTNCHHKYASVCPSSGLLATGSTVGDDRHEMPVVDWVSRTRLERGSIFSSGNSRLDALLPQGGFRRGSLVEWFGAGMGSGASVGGWWAAVAACQSGGVLVVMDMPFMQYGWRGVFYPPAIGSELSADQIVVVRPEGVKNLIWSLDQALRSPGVAAVWARMDQLSPRDFRRLQLSAEEGLALGCFVRPMAARGQPSWADLQIEVHSQAMVRGGWRVQLHLLRGRGLARPGVVQMEWGA